MWARIYWGGPGWPTPKASFSEIEPSEVQKIRGRAGRGASRPSVHFFDILTCHPRQKNILIFRIFCTCRQVYIGRGRAGRPGKRRLARLTRQKCKKIRGRAGRGASRPSVHYFHILTGEPRQKNFLIFPFFVLAGKYISGEAGAPGVYFPASI